MPLRKTMISFSKKNLSLFLFIFLCKSSFLSSTDYEVYLGGGVYVKKNGLVGEWVERKIKKRNSIGVKIYDAVRMISDFESQIEKAEISKLKIKTKILELEDDISELKSQNPLPEEKISDKTEDIKELNDKLKNIEANLSKLVSRKKLKEETLQRLRSLDSQLTAPDKNRVNTTVIESKGVNNLQVVQPVK